MLKTDAVLSATNVQLHAKYDLPQLLNCLLDIFECFCSFHHEREPKGVISEIESAL